MATPSKAGFTACKAKVREFDTVFEVRSEDGIRIATTSWHDNSPWFPTKCQSRANVGLIAEAFTVAHDTGLTPRQLAERCKELEEAARSAHRYLDSHGNGWEEADTLRELAAALSKATAGGAV